MRRTDQNRMRWPYEILCKVLWAFYVYAQISTFLHYVTQLDPMKIVIITYMNSYNPLNGHAQLSSRAESGFLLYVLCV